MPVKISLTADVYADQYASEPMAKVSDTRLVPELMDVPATLAKISSDDIDELREHVAGRVKALGKELDRQLEVVAEHAQERERKAKKDERDAEREQGPAPSIDAF